MPCVVQQSQHIHIGVGANIAQWSHTLVSYLLGRSISVRYRMNTNTANIYIICEESWNNNVLCGMGNTNGLVRCLVITRFIIDYVSFVTILIPTLPNAFSSCLK